jgi:hypothetical protein
MIKLSLRVLILIAVLAFLIGCTFTLRPGWFSNSHSRSMGDYIIPHCIYFAGGEAECDRGNV